MPGFRFKDYPLEMRLRILRELDDLPRGHVYKICHREGISWPVLNGWRQNRALYEEMEAHPGFKRCGRCKEWKVHAEFSRSRQNPDGLNSYCRPCDYQYKRAWAKKDATKARAQARKNHLRSTYGITVEQQDAMLEAQGHRCLICGTKFDDIKPRVPGGPRYTIDHCHDSKKVRGLLCGPCNLGLGNFKDDLGRLREAIEYLKSQEETEVPCVSMVAGPVRTLVWEVV